MQFEMQNILPAATCGKRWVKQIQRDTEWEWEGPTRDVAKDWCKFKDAFGYLPKYRPKQKTVYLVNG